MARLIKSHHDEYLAAYGIDLKLTRACALAWEQAEAAGIEREAFTSDWHDVVTDPAVDIVVELIGGEHPATEIFTTAFEHGKHVVSANKALLGRHVETLAEKARACGVQIKCEASCGGGIPIVSTLEHDLVGNKILTIAGILNGTTNYILSRMDAEGADYADVLADAQAKRLCRGRPVRRRRRLRRRQQDGDPRFHRLWHPRYAPMMCYQQGIRTIGAEDIAQARELGYTIKLLGIARNTDAGVDVRVHPTLIPADHMLAKVNGAMNAVYVVGDAVGETMFYGAGAGSFPTASAVVGDILSLSEQISRGVAPLPEIEPYGHNLTFKPMDELQTKYYVRLKVADRVGALSETVDIFAKHNISISLINQVEDGKSGVSDACSVIFLTHRALEKDVQAAAAELASVGCVAEVANVLRIEDVEAWTEGVMAN